MITKYINFNKNVGFFYFENSLMVLNTNNKPPRDIIILYLNWLSNSDYKYHIDDDPYDITNFNKFSADILKKNIDYIFENITANDMWLHYDINNTNMNTNNDIFEVLLNNKINWFGFTDNYHSIFENLSNKKDKEKVINKYPNEFDFFLVMKKASDFNI